jgi:ATP-dependent phosphofructokinase / diphosphate-dependent phosphofructokinase
MKIAVNTGGGDAPGLNAVIRAVTLAGIRRGWEVVGIRNGYRSLLDPDTPLMTLDRDAVRGITLRGGTILGTANRGNPFEMPVRNEDGTWRTEDWSDKLVARFREEKIDALVAIGGDGSMRIASMLIKKGIPVVGVPKTIDNDLPETDFTLGFDTAVSIATDAIDRIQTTAESHERVMVVEVMGRYAGWIALHAGLSASADVILIPEIPFDLAHVAAKIRENGLRGRHHSIIVVAEGAKENGSGVMVKGKVVGQAEQLGGIGAYVAQRLGELTGKETRSVVLGHLQRGGSPTTFDRLISLKCGAEAVRMVEEGAFNQLVILKGFKTKRVPIPQIAGGMKTVPLDGDAVSTARELGVSFGDMP